VTNNSSSSHRTCDNHLARIRGVWLSEGPRLGVRDGPELGLDENMYHVEVLHLSNLSDKGICWLSGLPVAWVVCHPEATAASA